MSGELNSDNRTNSVSFLAGNPMALTGDQLQILHEALLSAFRTRASLTQLLKFRMNESLDEIAGSGSHRNTRFEVLEWAEATGRTEELINAARNENPGNVKLKAAAEQLLPRPSSSPPPLADPPTSSSPPNTGLVVQNAPEANTTS